MSDWMSVHDWVGVDNRCSCGRPLAWELAGRPRWRAWVLAVLEVARRRWRQWGIGRVEVLVPGSLVSTVARKPLAVATYRTVRVIPFGSGAVGTDLVVAFSPGLFVADAGAELVRRVVD
ncbi:hypothetical protein HPB52_017913 [Rhipicephalus sanguineus]|uniref:Uncharacterized protein n=1 Tax=Rhipicephalus sanguineus TaxID=34632 RepID=A0A9D4Q1N4_RHISA|nr:hypothetical protein HPB52_017913 [Rhipicephalus sanguineus]